MNRHTTMSRVRLQDIWEYVIAWGPSLRRRPEGMNQWIVALIIMGLFVYPPTTQPQNPNPNGLKLQAAADFAVCGYPSYQGRYDFKLDGHDLGVRHATVAWDPGTGKPGFISGHLVHIYDNWRDDQYLYEIPFQGGMAQKANVTIKHGGIQELVDALPLEIYSIKIKIGEVEISVTPDKLPEAAAEIENFFVGQGWEGQAAAVVAQIAITASIPNRCGALEPPQYLVTVQTGSHQDAGTNANVSISLGRPDGSMGLPQRLDNADVDDFERWEGWEPPDSFVIIDDVVRNQLDQLPKIRLCHDNKGDKPGWYVESVTVTCRRTGVTWMFPVDRWLARDECDRSTCVDLKRGELPPALQPGCRL